MKKMLIISATLLLAACHHDNPLQTHSKQKSAAFLMHASANVEKRLRFAGKLGDRGYAYMECMEDKKNPDVDCNKLYQGMVRFAKEGHFKGFQSLTLADLTNKEVFERLGDDYAEVMMSTDPKYYKEG